MIERSVVPSIHRDDFIIAVDPDAADTCCDTTHRSDIVFVEADAEALLGCENDIIVSFSDLDFDKLVAFVEFDCLFAVRPLGLVLHDVGLFDGSVFGSHHDEFAFNELFYRKNCRDLLVFFDVDEVDDRFAAAVTVSLRKLVDLCPVDLAVRCEEQKQRVAACDENVLDVVVFLRIYRVDALAAAFLLAVEVKRSAFA